MTAHQRATGVGRWVGAALMIVATTGLLVLTGMSPAAAATDRLATGQALTSGQSLVSGNGAYRLVMQPDGNAVVYNAANVAQWASRTGGNPGARLVVQADGNVVVYSAANRGLWATGTRTTNGRLVMQADGNVVVYSASDAGLWASKRSAGALDSLIAGEKLTAGQRITSPNGRYFLTVGGDGNAVVYDENDRQAQRPSDGSTYIADRTALWDVRSGAATWFPLQAGSLLTMQADGNLVYSASGRVLWHTRTSNNPGSRLVMQNDGNLALYAAAGAARWSAGIRPEGVLPTLASTQLIDCHHVAVTNGQQTQITMDYRYTGGSYYASSMSGYVYNFRGEPLTLRMKFSFTTIGEPVPGLDESVPAWPFSFYDPRWDGPMDTPNDWITVPAGECTS
jgi:hypothetical protein